MITTSKGHDTIPRAIIDLEALAANYALLCEKAGRAATAAAVKANAYGLGLGPVCRTLYGAGCRTFFTAHFNEALEARSRLSNSSSLRATTGSEAIRSKPESYGRLMKGWTGLLRGIHAARHDGLIVDQSKNSQSLTIAPLHGVAEFEAQEAIERRIIPVLNDLGSVERWQKKARNLGRRLPVMIHLDTGMNRLGLSPEEQGRLADDWNLVEGLDVQLWISHLACADEAEHPMTPEQLARFREALAGLPKAPASLCNSAGIFWGPDYHFDIVRPGLALYGGNPTPDKPNPMRAVLTLQAPILQVRSVDTSMTIGYGASHRFSRRGRTATLALGYADGYHRALGGRGTVMIGGFAAPLIGRISMDLITVDVTEVPEAAVFPGAMATLIGHHRTLDEAAEEGGTIAYELLTSLGARLERVYQGGAAA